MIEIRKGTKQDTETFIRLMASVRQSMDHKEWLYLDPPEDVRDMMKNGVMSLWVAMDGNQMVGAFDALHPGLDAYNYGYVLGYSKEDLQLVINMDTAVVHPEYRGLGLQKKLMRYAEETLSMNGKHILLCTVHPDNRYSLNNVLSQGYTIQKTTQMYGSVRHVLAKEIG